MPANLFAARQYADRTTTTDAIPPRIDATAVSWTHPPPAIHQAEPQLHLHRKPRNDSYTSHFLFATATLHQIPIGSEMATQTPFASTAHSAATLPHTACHTQ